MKLVIATPLYPPEIGGPATYSKILENGLLSYGIEVSIVKFCDVRHLPKLVRHFVYFFRVLRALRKADAVLALDPVSTGLPASMATLILRKPFFVKIVGDYAWEQGRQRFGIIASLDDFVKEKHVPFLVWFLRKVQKGVAMRSRAVIVPSEYLKGIVMTWGVSEKNIHVIYNAVPNEAVGIVPTTVTALAGPLVVSVGRLVPWKNMEGIVEAVASLRLQDTSVSLVIIGNGPEGVRLSAHAKKTLGTGYVFTGELSHADTLAVMKHAQVFVLNSSYEGFSHTLIEALSLGVFSIATKVGGNSEIIKNGENGILTKVGDTSNLSEAIGKSISDDTLHSRICSKAKDSVSRFSVDAMLSTTADLLVANVRARNLST